MDKNLIKLFEENIEPNACKGGKREGEHAKMTELINKEIGSDYSIKLHSVFDSFAGQQRASDENDRSLKFGVIMQNFIDNQLLGDQCTFDVLIEMVQKNHAKPDQIFDKTYSMKSSITKTQTSDEGEDKEVFVSDLH